MPADLSKYSDEQLFSMQRAFQQPQPAQQPPQQPALRDLSKISDAELFRLRDIAATKQQIPTIAATASRPSIAEQPKAAGRGALYSGFLPSDSQIPTGTRAALSLVAEDPKLGVAYLQRKGYEARATKSGDLEFKDPTGKWARVNPSGLDAGDVIGVIPDLLEAGASTFASGAKAAGALGAPTTGGASLLAGSALGGAATGAVEAGKQGLAKLIGARDEMDYGRIGQQAGLGAAVPLGVGAVGAGLKKLGGSSVEGLRKLYSEGPIKKIDAQGIQEAGAIIGAKPTPGMLTSDQAIRNTEALLTKQSGSPFGRELRQQIQTNEQAALDTAQALVMGKTAKTPFEVGEAFSQKLQSAVAEKLKPAEDIYNNIESQLKEVPANLAPLKKAIKDAKDIFNISDDAMAVIKKFEKKVETLKNVRDLKVFRTIVNDELAKMSSKNTIIVTERIVAGATKARHESFLTAAKGRSPQGQFIRKPDPALIEQLGKADKIYKDTVSLVQKSVLRQGEPLTDRLKRQLSESLEKTVPEKRLDRFLPKQDVARARALKELAPEAFSELTQARIADMAARSMSTARGELGAINPKKLAQEIEKLSPEIAGEIFGADGVRKAKALAKFYQAIPKDINPSGTATSLANLAPTASLISSASLSSVNQLLRNEGPIIDAARKLGSVSGKLTNASVFMALNEILKKQEASAPKKGK